MIVLFNLLSHSMFPWICPHFNYSEVKANFAGLDKYRFCSAFSMSLHQWLEERGQMNIKVTVLNSTN